MNIKSKELQTMVEIMAPAGNFSCLTAAAQGGAHAVYFGVGDLNMRAHAARNFKVEDLPAVTAFCRDHGMRSYLTLNVVLYDHEMQAAAELLDAAVAAGVDAVIASDMAAILMARARGLEVHLSTQLNISNVEALKFYARFAEVAVLARELNLSQIAHMAEAVRTTPICGPSGRPIRLELFCHGALCMAVSGKCYLSLAHYNASANRGSCLQLCRRPYEVKDMETGTRLVVDGPYIMSPKDLSTIGFLDKILASGIEVLKIEGRARAPEYVKTVTEAYRQGVDAVQSGAYSPEVAAGLEARLAKVFNRGFWGGYYQGALMGEWSKVYGSQATEKKVYVGKITNYFSRLGVAEALPEAVPLPSGSKVLVMGPTTGVVETVVNEIRLNGPEAVPVAPQGVRCAFSVPEKVRRGDDLYIVTAATI